MTNKTILNPLGFNRAAICRHIQEEDKDYILAVFPRTRWILFRNNNYFEDVETTINETNEFYKTVSSIPKYQIHKNNKKVSFALPRLDVNGNRYLFIPKGLKSLNKGKGKSMYTYALKKEFYIFNIDGEYNINDKADIVF